MKRILFVQYPDFRSQYTAMARGEPETYYCEKAVVDFICGLQARHGNVCVLSLWGTEYDEVLPCGVRSVGVRFLSPVGKNIASLSLADDFSPTHVVIRCPISRVVNHYSRGETRILVTIADNFRAKSLQGIWGARMFARSVADGHVDFVANHNIPASRRLEAIGVSPEKIVPWEWPWPDDSCDAPGKKIPAGAAPRRILYAGVVSVQKGVGDLIEAMRILKASGHEMRLTVAGRGDIDVFSRQARVSGLEGSVEFLGLKSHTKVMELMRACDVVVVPSRSSSSEGMPCVLYEALLARTPLVVSDHPMIRSKIQDGVDGLVFKAGSARSLAIKIGQLLRDAGLYQALSSHSSQTYLMLKEGVNWFDLVRKWVSGDADERLWLESQCLAKRHNSLRFLKTSNV